MQAGESAIGGVGACFRLGLHLVARPVENGWDGKVQRWRDMLWWTKLQTAGVAEASRAVPCGLSRRGPVRMLLRASDEVG